MPCITGEVEKEAEIETQQIRFGGNTISISSWEKLPLTSEIEPNKRSFVFIYDILRLNVRICDSMPVLSFKKDPLKQNFNWQSKLFLASCSFFVFFESMSI
jgi:hypothetical protein